MSTIVVSGSASGMGAATTARLRAGGHQVIGIDLHRAEVVCDLGTPEGRAHAVEAVGELSGGSLDGLVTFAGVGPLPSRPSSRVVSVNYFGTVALLDGLRPLLALGEHPSAVAISSNSASAQPHVPLGAVDDCLSGDETRAMAAADRAGWANGYAISKIAVARWVRRQAPGPEWAGCGIRLNAIAPGVIETPLHAEGMADPVLRPLLEAFKVPVGFIGQADDIASLVLFLLGPDSRYFCGSIVYADGGTDAELRADDWPNGWTPA